MGRVVRSSLGARCRVLCAALLAAAACVAADSATAADAKSAQPRFFGVSEDSIRELALYAPLPRLPPGYRPTRREVAVAQVEITQDGALVAVTVHEAPSADTARALFETLRSWRFAPMPRAVDKGHYMGKLTFYFIPAPGGVRVLSAQEILADDSPAQVRP